MATIVAALHFAERQVIIIGWPGWPSWLVLAYVYCILILFFCFFFRVQDGSNYLLHQAGGVIGRSVNGTTLYAVDNISLFLLLDNVVAFHSELLMQCKQSGRVASTNILIWMKSSTYWVAKTKLKSLSGYLKSMLDETAAISGGRRYSSFRLNVIDKLVIHKWCWKWCVRTRRECPSMINKIRWLTVRKLLHTPVVKQIYDCFLVAAAG